MNASYPTQKQQEETQSPGSSESNPSSGHAYESIYDKYSAKSSDQEEGDVMEVKSLEESRKDPIGKIGFSVKNLVRKNVTSLIVETPENGCTECLW